MRILFFTSNEEDYLADSLFHGLRSLLGAQVVDFPKNEAMYRSYPDESAAPLYGRGFTLYRTLDEAKVDRFHVMRDLRSRRFDLVVFSDIWRQVGLYIDCLRFLADCNVAIVDGADSPISFPYTRELLPIAGLWMSPGFGRRFVRFKRELVPNPEDGWSWRVLARFTGAWPSPAAVLPIAFSIPDDKIVAAPPAKIKPFPVHVVDPELASRIGARTTYAFESEREYYLDLQRSRFGITTKRAGWDCLRHYEIAANGAVPCFRDLRKKPPTCAPHGLGDDNCISYGSADELLARIDRLTDAEYSRLQRGALAWATGNSTRARATSFLRDVGLSLSA